MTMASKSYLKVQQRRQDCLEHIAKRSYSKLNKLAENGFDFNFHDPNTGETPLTATVSDTGTPLSAIYLLLNSGASLSLTNQSGLSPIQAAILANNTTAVEVLGDFGLDLKADPNGGTPLLSWAIQNGAALSVISKLLRMGVSLNATDCQGYTPIHHATQMGERLLVELLVYFGASLDSQSIQSGDTPMHLAAHSGDLSMLRTLLMRGADKTLKNFSGFTADQLGEMTGNVEVVKTIANHNPEYIYTISTAAVIPQELRNLKELRYNSDRFGSLSNLSSRRKSPLKHSVSSGSLNRLKGKDVGGSVRSTLRKITDSLRGVPSEMKQEGDDGRVRLFQELPGTYYRVLKNYTPTLASHVQTDLPLEKGTLVEVLYVGDNGMLEGRVGDKIGWFPSFYVETSDCKGGKFGSQRSGGLFGRKMARRYGFPREVKLKKQKKIGYGFVIRGAMAPVPNFIPTPEFPALQYFDSVDKGGSAEKAGLRPGDFILEFNGEDVRGITHNVLVEKIRQSADGFTMKVMTPYRSSSAVMNLSVPSKRIIGAPLPPQRNPNTSLSLNRIKSPSLDQLHTTYGENSDDETSENSSQSKGNAGHNGHIPPSSLQNLFQTASSQPTSPNLSNYQGGVSKPKLFISARNSPKSSNRNSPAHGYSQSALDIREHSQSSESLNDVTSREPKSSSRNSMISGVNASSTLSLNIPSSRSSTLIEEDEEAQIAAIDSKRGVYANLSYHNLNNHKPVIKSKSKDPTIAQNGNNNSSLKSTFYNLSKSKKPAPPPPPKRKQKEKKATTMEPESQLEHSYNLQSNLYLSDLALAEKNSQSVEQLTFGKSPSGNSSFKPNPTNQTPNVTFTPEVKVETIEDTTDEYELTLEIPPLSLEASSSENGENSTEPTRIPTPDYSDSESDDEESSNASTLPEMNDAIFQHSGQLNKNANEKREFDLVREARDKPLQDVTHDMSDLDLYPATPSQTSTLEYPVVENLPLQGLQSQRSTNHTETSVRAQNNEPSSSNKASNRNSWRQHEENEFALCSPANVVVTEKQPVVQFKPAGGGFQGDLLAAINKRKAQMDQSKPTSSTIDPVELKLKNKLEPKTMTYKPEVSTMKVKVERSAEKEMKSNESFMGNSSDSLGSEDVDALINQFYVPPPPEKLLEESHKQPTTSNVQTPQTDQGYESASASPDSTRSERQAPVSTFLKQRQIVSASLTTGFVPESTKPSTPACSVSGSGDRTNSRRSLTEILTEHENRIKSGPDWPTKLSTSTTATTQLPNPADSRSAAATEVLSRSNYPKSERLLQLINQSVTGNKQSYLNSSGQQTKTTVVLPPKPSIQNLPKTAAPSQNSVTPAYSSTPKAEVERNQVLSSHTYPRFDTSTKNRGSSEPLISTPRFGGSSTSTAGMNHQSPPAQEKPRQAAATSAANENKVSALAVDMQPVDQWDVDTVCEWLRSIKMADYIDKFRSNDIAGSHLKMLTKDDLAELGVTSLGHRLTLDKAIRQLPN